MNESDTSIVNTFVKFNTTTTVATESYRAPVLIGAEHRCNHTGVRHTGNSDTSAPWTRITTYGDTEYTVYSRDSARHDCTHAQTYADNAIHANKTDRNCDALCLLRELAYGTRRRFAITSLCCRTRLFDRTETRLTSQRVAAETALGKVLLGVRGEPELLAAFAAGKNLVGGSRGHV